MIESVLIDALSKRLDGTKVSTSVPDGWTDRPLVVISQTGGGSDRPEIGLGDYQVSVMAYGATRVDALELSSDVASEMLGVYQDDARIKRIKTSGYAWFPDETGRARYQIVYSITYKE